LRRGATFQRLIQGHASDGGAGGWEARPARVIGIDSQALPAGDAGNGFTKKSHGNAGFGIS
jgi:hypothetical protein